jgi:acyl transferase domain-containing protein/SAM-dependent methyltransferase
MSHTSTTSNAPDHGVASNNNAIAIVGIGCRFPAGSNNVDSFWQLLSDGVDAITEIPPDRWDLKRYYDPDPERLGKTTMRLGGFIQDIDRFDPSFFGIAPREAEFLDPQQRLLLEVTWEALEDAGYAPETLAGTATSVFIGSFCLDHQLLQLGYPGNRELIGSHSAIGGGLAMLANRISYSFNFRGPSVTLDTACSSSLVAVHLACQSLRTGECSFAIAGGVNLSYFPEANISVSKGGFLSPDGRCKAFDASANGYVRGEGAGTVLLQPLADALAADTPIYAIIRGSAVNQDGRSNGITVPDKAAQISVMREAYQRAGVLPSQVSYVEAHGTGTPVGDPIEAGALDAVLSTGRKPGDKCLVGSVKTNIGHLEAAAGIAGLIKASLSLRNRWIPKNLHFKNPNPNIPFDDMCLRVADVSQPWPSAERPAFAAVNSFGYGGTNAHVVLEEAPEPVTTHVVQEEAASDAAYLFVFSGRSSEAVTAYAQLHVDLLTSDSPQRETASLRDIGYTLSLRRSHHDRRLAVVAHSTDELAENLAAFLAGERRPGVLTGRVESGERPGLVFVFTGMGPQWWAMGRELLQREPVFREVIERCDALFQRHAGWSLLDQFTADEQHSRMAETQIAQTTNFALQVALTALWRSHGIIPDAIVGHSVGEVAAAYEAGALSLEDAIKVSFHRSRVQQLAAGQGTMIAVEMPHQAANDALSEFQGRVSIAAINSPSSITFSGDHVALEELARSLSSAGYFCRTLNVEVAYHSHQMDPFKEEFLSSLEELAPRTPSIPLYSTVTGQHVNGPSLDGSYWWKNIRDPVRFNDVMDLALQDGNSVFLQVGPHPVLSSAIAECAAHQGRKVEILSSLRRQTEERGWFLGSVGSLFTLGFEVNWPHLYDQGCRFVRLPSYPWQRQRYWHESEESTQHRLGTKGHPLLGDRLPAPHPTWKVEVSSQRFSYLRDHKVQGAAVFPGAGFIEMGLAAGREIWPDAPYVIDRIEFHSALVLEGPDYPELHFQFHPGNGTFEIHSVRRPINTQISWNCHATGRLKRIEAPRPLGSEAIAAVQSRCKTVVSGEEFYEAFRTAGLSYDDCFRGVTQIFCGKHEALGRVETPTVLLDTLASYQLHPAVLDACVQVTRAALYVETEFDPSVLYLPVKVGRVQVYKGASLTLWSHCRILEHTIASAESNISIYDEGGDLVAEITGFRVQAFAQQSANQNGDDEYLFAYEWRGRARPGSKMPGCTQYLSAPHQIREDMTSEIGRLLREVRRQSGVDVTSQLNYLCIYYVVDALSSVGWNLRTQQRVGSDYLFAQIPVAQHPLAETLINLLVERGILHRINEDLEVVSLPVKGSAQAHWRALMAQFPAHYCEFSIVNWLGRSLAGLLTGSSNADQLIAPGESDAMIDRLYANSPLYRASNKLAQIAITKAIGSIPKVHAARVLGIGAHVGGLAREIARFSATQTHYYLADTSDVVLAEAKRSLEGYPLVRFALLDERLNVLDAGLQLEAADVVVMSDFPGRDLPQLLAHARRLLAPGGLLVTAPRTNGLLWYELFLEVLESVHGSDQRSAIAPHSSVPASLWTSALSGAGFEEVTDIGADDIEGLLPRSTMIARVPPIARAVRSEELIVTSAGLNGISIVFADSGQSGEELVRSLSARGEHCVTVLKSDAFQQISATQFKVRPNNSEDMKHVLELAKATSRLCRLVHCWSLDAAGPEYCSGETLHMAESLGCHSVVSLVQAMAGLEWLVAPRLWLVTRGVHRVGEQGPDIAVAQAPVWGLARSIRHEHPNWRYGLVDLDPADTAKNVEFLADELLVDDDEDEVALRGVHRYVHRLVGMAA